MKDQSIAKYINEFVELHQNAPYLLWKKADHAHQSDLCFIVGNILGQVKNSHLSDALMSNNVGAVNMFLDNSTKEQI